MIQLSNKRNENLIPVIPIRDGIVFPHTESILTFGRPKSLAANPHLPVKELFVLSCSVTLSKMIRNLQIFTQWVLFPTLKE